MSESLGEQVNIRIAGEELPDAFMGVGFSNYDISRYGDDGTFIDLTPYLTEEYMPNLSRILEENPDIRSAIRNCRKITDATCLEESPEIQGKRLSTRISYL